MAQMDSVMSLSPVERFSRGSAKRDVAAVPRLGLTENISLHLTRFKSIQSPCNESATCFYCNAHVAGPSAPFDFELRYVTVGARISQLFF